MNGTVAMVSVAASLVTVPTALVNTARNLTPLSELLSPLRLSLSEVAPLRLVYVAPSFVERCHCTVGAGLPEAFASIVVCAPSSTYLLSGCWVTAGLTSTVSVAALLVATPFGFVNVARNS